MMSFNESLSMATELPQEIWTTILNFAFDQTKEYFYSSRRAIINVLSEVSHDFHKLTKKLDISIATEQPHWTDNISCYCCANGYGSLLEYALMSGTQPTYRQSSLAARHGNLNCLKILEEYGRATNFTLSQNDLTEASLNGHIDVVKYLMGKGVMPIMMTLSNAVRSGNIELVKLLQSPEIAIEKAGNLAQYATSSGNLEMVKFIEQYFPLKPSDMSGSAYKGSIEILQYYLDKGFTLTEDTFICSTAAEHRQWKYLKFALDHGAPMSADLMTALAKANAVELMREFRAKGCPWSITAVRQAAKVGHLEALKYLIENGCPFTEPQLNGFNEHYDIHYEPTVIAARYNHIECLKYLIEIGAPLPADILNKCINYKTSLTVIKYLRERGCPWNEQTTAIAAQEASVQCLVYALDNGYPRNDSTMDSACLSRSLEVLKICHQRGIPWNNQTCALLIQVGTVEMLKYAHENGALWTSDTIAVGLDNLLVDARLDCLDCLKYAIDHGCPWDPQRTLAIAQSRRIHKKIAQWIIENYNVTKPDDASN